MILCDRTHKPRSVWVCHQSCKQGANDTNIKHSARNYRDRTFGQECLEVFPLINAICNFERNVSVEFANVGVCGEADDVRYFSCTVDINVNGLSDGLC